MSTRTIRVSLTFTFEPDGEHEHLFEDMTEDEMMRYALSMAVEDAQRAEPRMFDIELEEEA
jgi:hypothetical protein